MPSYSKGKRLPQDKQPADRYKSAVKQTGEHPSAMRIQNHLTDSGHRGDEAQADHLHGAHFQSAQRHIMASQIGHVQGNAYLQSIMAKRNQGLPTPGVQRDTIQREKDEKEGIKERLYAVLKTSPMIKNAYTFRVRIAKVIDEFI